MGPWARERFAGVASDVATASIGTGFAAPHHEGQAYDVLHRADQDLLAGRRGRDPGRS